MIKYLHLAPLTLFSIYFTKVCFFSASYPEAIILTTLGLVACYFQSKDNDKKLKALEEKIDSATKYFNEKELDIKRLQESLNSLKLGALVRPMNVQSNNK